MSTVQPDPAACRRIVEMSEPLHRELLDRHTTLAQALGADDAHVAMKSVMTALMAMLVVTAARRNGHSNSLAVQMVATLELQGFVGQVMTCVRTLIADADQPAGPLQ